MIKQDFENVPTQAFVKRKVRNQSLWQTLQK